MTRGHYALAQNDGNISGTDNNGLHTVFLYRPANRPWNSMKLKQKLAMRYTRAQLNILSLVSLRKSAEKAFRVFITPR